MSDAPPPPDADSAASEPPPLRSVHTTNFPQLLAEAARERAGHHLPGRQAGHPAERRRRAEHALPQLRQADGPGRRPAAGSPSARASRSGNFTTSRRCARGWTLKKAKQSRRARIPKQIQEPKSEIQNLSTTPASSRAAATPPATCKSTRWPGSATNCGSSTRVSPAWRRASEANSFDAAGGRRSSTALLPGDCCHLNGLAMRDGRVRYVTALGETERARRLAREQTQRRRPDRR